MLGLARGAVPGLLTNAVRAILLLRRQPLLNRETRGLRDCAREPANLSIGAFRRSDLTHLGFKSVDNCALRKTLCLQ